MRWIPRGKKAWVWSFVRVGAAFAVVLGLLFFFQEKLLFAAQSVDPALSYAFEFPHEEIFLSVGEQKISTLFIPVEKPRALILYFHGNAGHLGMWGSLGGALARKTNCSVWVLDYPGYGHSSGEVNSESQLHEIALAFWNEAHKREPQLPIIIFGRSMGTGLATELAAEHPPAALILETPFFSLRSVVAGRIPWLPLVLLKYQFRSDENLARVTSPVLILHGTADRVIPYDEAQRLVAVQPRAKLVTFEGGSHNDLAQFPEYEPAVLGFLDEVLGAPSLNR